VDAFADAAPTHAGHRSRMMMVKLGVRTVADLVHLAERAGTST
jgi:hypothetical protein